MRKAVRFVCDEQLGRLARWLRLQGFDTVYRCPFPDTELLHCAQAEGRILITRDGNLSAKTLFSSIVVIQSTDYQVQLAELRRMVKAGKPRSFSRCLDCNEPIGAVAKEQAKGKVPEEVFKTYQEFYTCPSCRKIFWKGSHVKNSAKRLARLSL